jgi:YidC/Oxa1 family membrane protein insertase
MLSSAIPVVGELFQWLLNSIGWVLAKIYDFVPNYGVSIIILTLIIRFILFPLGVKQIKSMQHMQAIQPKIKDIQKKYKGNKQKAQEETMKLYKEAGVNPLGGCLPVLAQFPILISMYAVIRAPSLLGLDPAGQPVAEGQQAAAYEVMNNHLPVNSRLFADTIQHEHTSLIIVNLQCSAAQAGTQAPIKDTQGTQVIADQPLVNGENDPIVGVDDQTFESKPALDCGDSSTDKIAYIAMLLFMVATTFYQQRQMQKASPPNAASSQQQAIMKVMPLFFGFIGFTFPAGLVLYWTTSNLFQIGQQTLLLRAGHIGPDALEKRMAEQKERQASRGDTPAKKGIIGSMLARAEDERKRRDTDGDKPNGTKSTGSKGSNPRSSGTRGSGTRGSNPRSGTGKGGTSGKGGSAKGTPPKSTKGRPTGGTKGSTPPRGTKKPGNGSGGNGEPGS